MYNVQGGNIRLVVYFILDRVNNRTGGHWTSGRTVASSKSAVGGTRLPQGEHEDQTSAQEKKSLRGVANWDW